MRLNESVSVLGNESEGAGFMERMNKLSRDTRIQLLGTALAAFLAKPHLAKAQTAQEILTAQTRDCIQMGGTFIVDRVTRATQCVLDNTERFSPSESAPVVEAEEFWVDGKAVIYKSLADEAAEQRRKEGLNY